MIGATPPSSMCRGANLSLGRAAGGCASLRPIPGKALFFRREAQTLRREEFPPAAGVCASLPGKPYSSGEGRKPFVGKAAGGCRSLRLTPGKALFLRREAQTFHREKPPAAVRVCASLPGKAYSSVERRKLFAGKRRRRLCEFAPRSRESLISPSRGANPLPGNPLGAFPEGLRRIPRRRKRRTAGCIRR